MSRTKKDMPYVVRAKQVGHIDHNHSTGECIVGTWKDQRKITAQKNAHRDSCPRFVYEAECVHSHERDEYQAKVDHARHVDKGNYAAAKRLQHVYPKYAATRPLASKAMDAMLEAGFFPNCSEEKTHKVDRRALDFGLLDGERIGSTVYSWRGLPHERPRYDASIACSFCDEHKNITCWITDDGRPGRGGCSCCSYNDERPHKNARRASTRDSLRGAAKEFNTVGSVSA